MVVNPRQWSDLQTLNELALHLHVLHGWFAHANHVHVPTYDDKVTVESIKGDSLTLAPITVHVYYMPEQLGPSCLRQDLNAQHNVFQMSDYKLTLDLVHFNKFSLRFLFPGLSSSCLAWSSHNENMIAAGESE